MFYIVCQVAITVTYTEAKRKVCIYVHFLITNCLMIYEENLSLNGIKSLIDLSSLQLFVIEITQLYGHNERLKGVTL